MPSSGSCECLGGWERGFGAGFGASPGSKFLRAGVWAQTAVAAPAGRSLARVLLGGYLLFHSARVWNVIPLPGHLRCLRPSTAFPFWAGWSSFGCGVHPCLVGKVSRGPARITSCCAQFCRASCRRASDRAPVRTPGATSGPGYKYCLLFSATRLSGALGAHGKRLFAQVCLSPADMGRQAERGHRLGLPPSSCSAAGVWLPRCRACSWAGLCRPLWCQCLLGLHPPAPQLPCPREGTTVSPGTTAGVFCLIPGLADALWG